MSEGAGWADAPGLCRCARTIENFSRIKMVVARASGTDLASSLRQNTFLTLRGAPRGGSGRDGGPRGAPGTGGHAGAPGRGARRGPVYGGVYDPSEHLQIILSYGGNPHRKEEAGCPGRV